MKTTVFFDLDGTLTDSRPGIFRGFSYAMTALGSPLPPEAFTNDVIGPPLFEAFSRQFGFSTEDATRAVALYREYYSRQGIFENEVYPGVQEMLERLRESGLRLAVATGKPHEYARRIVAHFGLDRYLPDVFGVEFDGTHGDKAELLSFAMQALGITADEAVMVGDRCYDMKAAIETHITPVGVLWGYGDREELMTSGGTLLAETPREACEIILDIVR